ARAELTVPGRYRWRYAAGAMRYNSTNWNPGFVEFDYGPDPGGQGVRVVAPIVAASHVAAMSAAFASRSTVTGDFDVTTGDVRVALTDTSCGDNSNATSIYRVDA